jgi:hypothetical protein
MYVLSFDGFSKICGLGRFSLQLSSKLIPYSFNLLSKKLFLNSETTTCCIHQDDESYFSLPCKYIVIIPASSHTRSRKIKYINFI